MSAVDFRRRLRELARFEPSGSPVVSVYLNTEWVDEHQRERVRIFVKNALAEARGRRWADRDDLDWIERQSGTLIECAVFEDANGAVLFACGSASLRELLPLRVPFDDTFVVDARPYVRPLAGIAGVVAGARHESSPVIADRAAGVLARVAQQADERRVDEALADAAEGSTAVAGVTATVGAVNRNAVRHLYVLTTFREPGAVCQDCGALQRGVHFTCPFCGRGTRTTELGEALVERVLASGGEVTTLESHRPLAGHGGVVARLRYAA